jgi:hypothetical protein
MNSGRWQSGISVQSQAPGTSLPPDPQAFQGGKGGPAVVHLGCRQMQGQGNPVAIHYQVPLGPLHPVLARVAYFAPPFLAGTVLLSSTVCSQSRR